MRPSLFERHGVQSIRARAVYCPLPFLGLQKGLSLNTWGSSPSPGRKRPLAKSHIAPLFSLSILQVQGWPRDPKLIQGPWDLLHRSQTAKDRICPYRTLSLRNAP